jgi:polysaccharide export outer membrane protein
MTTNQANVTRIGWLALAALCVLLALAGCSSAPSDFSAFEHASYRVADKFDYVIEPPDQVLITSKRVREFHNHLEVVSPDGKITLPLIGAVFVAGRTPEEVSEQLQVKAREYYGDADVSLRVVGYNSKHVYVFGEVSVPGAIAFRGNNTVLGTLAQTQPTRLADPGKIVVLRPNKDGKLVKQMTIDLNRMVKRGVTEHDALLENGDIIYVPPNPLAAVGLALQQVLLPIQPAASTVKGPSEIAYSVDTQPYGSESRVAR